MFARHSNRPGARSQHTVHGFVWRVALPIASAQPMQKHVTYGAQSTAATMGMHGTHCRLSKSLIPDPQALNPV